MTPKQEAKDLIGKYFRLLPQKEFITEQGGLKWNEWDNREHLEIAKQCALICVDKLLDCDSDILNYELHDKYYNEVKKEIELL